MPTAHTPAVVARASITICGNVFANCPHSNFAVSLLRIAALFHKGYGRIRDPSVKRPGGSGASSRGHVLATAAGPSGVR